MITLAARVVDVYLCVMAVWLVISHVRVPLEVRGRRGGWGSSFHVSCKCSMLYRVLKEVGKERVDSRLGKGKTDVFRMTVEGGVFSEYPGTKVRSLWENSLGDTRQHHGDQPFEFTYTAQECTIVLMMTTVMYAAQECMIILMSKVVWLELKVHVTLSCLESKVFFHVLHATTSTSLPQVYLRFDVLLAVRGTSQVFSETVPISANPPELKITAPGKIGIGDEAKVGVIFQNPLPVKMENVTLNVESDELLNGEGERRGWGERRGLGMRGGRGREQ